MSKHPERFLCLWLPHWPLQQLLVAKPELKEEAQTILLWERDARRGQLIVDCCRRARQRGVRIGMPLNEARALCSKETQTQSSRRKPTREPTRKPDAAVESAKPAANMHDAELDREQIRSSLERLAVWCERFSPLVGLEQVSKYLSPAEQKAWWPESLLMNITGIGQFFGGEARLAEDLTRALEQQGYFPRVAVADTVGCAWAAAHYHALAWDDPALSCFNATSQTAKQDHLLPETPWPRVVPIAQTKEVLSTLPVESLRLTAGTLSLLRQLGIECVGQLLQLPRTSLHARLGEELLPRIDQTLGHAKEMIEGVQPDPEYVARKDLEFPLSDREVIEDLINGLLVQIGKQLTDAGRGAMQLTVVLQCDAPQPQKFQKLHIGLYQPTAAADRIQQLVAMQLERLQISAAQEVELIEVQVLSTAKLIKEQTELFVDPEKADLKSLRGLIDGLSSRLGMQQVVQPQVTADPQPELACRWVPLAGQQKAFSDKPKHTAKRTAKASSPSSKKPSRRQNLHTYRPKLIRPLQLLTEPKRVDVVSVVPGGAPVRVRHAGGWQDVRRYWGPERIETSWWRGSSIRRDYYRVQTSDGRRLWLFRSLRDGRWFVQGYF